MMDERTSVTAIFRVALEGCDGDVNARSVIRGEIATKERNHEVDAIVKEYIGSRKR
jgi:hypothetical protein